MKESKRKGRKKEGGSSGMRVGGSERKEGRQGGRKERKIERRKERRKRN